MIDVELDADIDRGSQHAFAHAFRRCLQQHLRLQRLQKRQASARQLIKLYLNLK